LIDIVPAADLAPRYALSGSVDLDDGHLRLQALLTDRSGAVVWADTYTDALSVGRVMEIEQDIARKVATALAQPYGVIFRADAARPVPDAPEDWAAYACTLSYYAYRQSLDAPAHAKVRRCLEQAVERFPDYATAWGLLAQTYIDEVRFRFPADPAETEQALGAGAKIAAEEQRLPGHTEVIEWEDEKGKWHTETASGSDRPETDVKDSDA